MIKPTEEARRVSALRGLHSAARLAEELINELEELINELEELVNVPKSTRETEESEESEESVWVDTYRASLRHKGSPEFARQQANESVAEYRSKFRCGLCEGTGSKISDGSHCNYCHGTGKVHNSGSGGIFFEGEPKK